MLNLSLKKINARSPYVVSSVGEDAFSFTTDHGVNYELGFIEDHMLEIDKLYQFFLLTKNGVKPAKDYKILITVYAVLEEFFQDGNLILDYVCDTNDGRKQGADCFITGSKLIRRVPVLHANG